MSTKEITIPAGMVAQAIEAATARLGLAAQDIAEQAERKTPELHEPLSRFDAARALLGSIGPEQALAVRIGIEHLRELAEALREQARATVNVIDTARAEGSAEVVNRYQRELDDIERFVDALAADVRSGGEG